MIIPRNHREAKGIVAIEPEPGDDILPSVGLEAADFGEVAGGAGTDIIHSRVINQD